MNGWFRRNRGRLRFYYLNAMGLERCSTIGADTLSDADGWRIVGERGLNLLVGRPDAASVTFAELLERHLAYGRTKTGKPKSNTTIDTETRNAQRHLSHWRKRIATRIEPAEIQEWINAQSQGLQSKLKNHMSAVYQHAQKFGYISRTQESNPMNWVSASDPVGYEAVTITPEQAFAIFDSIEDELVRCLIVVLTATGIRLSEALGLTWSAVRWERGDILIRQRWANGQMDKPKSLASKSPVEMTSQLAEVLKLWRKETNYGKDSDLVFASDTMKGRQPRTGCTISQKYIRRVAEALGIIDKSVKRFGAHSFRHSLAEFLADQGTEPEVIQRILRHSTLPMAMHYTHLRKKARRAQTALLKKFKTGTTTGTGAKKKSGK